MSIHTSYDGRSGPKRPLIGLVGCVKRKAEHAAPARELYVSDLFLKRRAAVEGRVDRWFILSAEHGLVEPEQRIEPYDRSLAASSRDQRRVWASGILASLRDKLGDLGRYTFEIHAGASYFAFGLRDGLRNLGADVNIPTEGLSQGRQLGYYRGSTSRSNSEDERSSVKTTPIRSRYQSLGQHLAETQGDEVRLTFDEVEALIDHPLPQSARRHPAWWHALASSYGWRASPTVSENAVLFRRRTVNNR